MPFNILRHIEDFKIMVENQKKNDKSQQLNSSHQSGSKGKLNLFSGQGSGTQTPLLQNLFSGFKDTVNRKDNENVIRG